MKITPITLSYKRQTRNNNTGEYTNDAHRYTNLNCLKQVKTNLENKLYISRQFSQK